MLPRRFSSRATSGAFIWKAERPADWRERAADWPETRYGAQSLNQRPQGRIYLSFERA